MHIHKNIKGIQKCNKHKKEIAMGENDNQKWNLSVACTNKCLSFKRNESDPKMLKVNKKVVYGKCFWSEEEDKNGLLNI